MNTPLKIHGRPAPVCALRRGWYRSPANEPMIVATIADLRRGVTLPDGRLMRLTDGDAAPALTPDPGLAHALDGLTDALHAAGAPRVKHVDRDAKGHIVKIREEVAP